MAGQTEELIGNFTGPPMPLIETQTKQSTNITPVEHDGSFFDSSRNRFLGSSVLNIQSEETFHTMFYPKPAYDEYLGMDKVLTRHDRVDRLTRIYDELKHETMPRYLAVAGWAAAEAALMGVGETQTSRKALLTGAEEAWTRGMRSQLQINAREGALREVSQPLRLALDIAMLPLLEGMVAGDVTEQNCRDSFEASLEIARYNADLGLQAKEAGDIDAMQDHNGFSYELNCLLAINRRLSSSKFALPALARADSGHYLRHQSHDLLSLHQQWGRIRNAVPIEIKGRTSGSDRRRYKALLIRGQTYLCGGGLTVNETLAAIEQAYYEPDNEAVQIAEDLTGQITDMVKEYSLGEKLDMRAPRSVTFFRDNSRVMERFPGLQPGQGHLVKQQLAMVD